MGWANSGEQGGIEDKERVKGEKNESKGRKRDEIGTFSIPW